MDKKEFSTFVMALRTYYPKEQILPNEQAMALWYRELQDIPFDVAEAALRKWVSTNKWSPTIAEIRESASEISNGDIPDWGEGWQQVCDAMRKFGREYPKSAYASMHPVVAEAAKQLCNWWDLCCSPNLEQNRTNFRMIYEPLASKRRTQQQIALPLQENINRLRVSFGENGQLQIGFGGEDA